jgi:hypothetical protein
MNVETVHSAWLGECYTWSTLVQAGIEVPDHLVEEDGWYGAIVPVHVLEAHFELAKRSVVSAL